MAKQIHRLGNAFDSRAALVVCKATQGQSYFYYSDKKQFCLFCGKAFVVTMEIRVRDVPKPAKKRKTNG